LSVRQDAMSPYTYVVNRIGLLASEIHHVGSPEMGERGEKW
jgi:hypothetical protein